ncbi:MAG TPA: FtsX-like permease family protein, partial [Blastocatellia bacterium]|nr:FtsX-like permease family protein [Blastocatellia bacterium]
ARDANFVVRTTSDASSYVQAIRSVLSEIAPGQVMYAASWMEDLISDSMSDRRFVLIVLSAFSVLSLVLASVGIYGVVSYSVAQRKHEIGVRVALGAARGRVLGMVLGQGAKLMLCGIGIGIAGAVGLTRFLNAYLFGVSPTDPLTFAWIMLALSMVAMFASILPARRAMGVDPIAALRYE